MKIYLVRHGQSLANVDWDVNKRIADHAISLSTMGEQQVLEVGEVLCNHFNEIEQPSKSVRLWTSPYLRTRQTAQGIIESNASHFIKDQKEHPLLCEQQFGLFDGLSDEERAIQYPAEYEHYLRNEQFEGRFWARMPLGESRFDVAVRIHQSFGTFKRDAEKHGIDTIIVVCHGVTLRAFTMMWLHHTPEWFDQEPNPKNCAIRLIEGNQDMGYLFDGFKNR